MGTFRRLAFIVLGITSIMDSSNPLNLYRLVVGLVIGLLFGMITTLFLKTLLLLFNPSAKKDLGSKAFKDVVNRGMLFLIPFAIMSLIATLYLHWDVNGSFISVALMTSGIGCNTELGKVTGKPMFKNTIVTTVIAGLFSGLWLIAIPYIGYLPGYVEGGINLLLRFMDSGVGGMG